MQMGHVVRGSFTGLPHGRLSCGRSRDFMEYSYNPLFDGPFSGGMWCVWYTQRG